MFVYSDVNEERFPCQPKCIWIACWLKDQLNWKVMKVIQQTSLIQIFMSPDSISTLGFFLIFGILVYLV